MTVIELIKELIEMSNTFRSGLETEVVVEDENFCMFEAISVVPERDQIVITCVD